MLAARIAAMAMGLSFKDLVLLWHDLSVVNLLIEIMYNDDSADFHISQSLVNFLENACLVGL